jgi:dienelactone hydrolase
MIVFGPGFMQCGGPYSQLLRSVASAGYVVVVVNFPHSDCTVGAAATEADMVNQPGDMSYVITRMLAVSAASRGAFSTLIDSREIGVAGQSDGGDTVAAIAANTCCGDRRVRAVAVYSGAEWPAMPGRFFTRRPVPMLLVQGTADTVNPPGCSVRMYHADSARERYYLDLFGAPHTRPYWGSNDPAVLGQQRVRAHRGPGERRVLRPVLARSGRGWPPAAASRRCTPGVSPAGARQRHTAARPALQRLKVARFLIYTEPLI